jgi:hypothetical protein
MVSIIEDLRGKKRKDKNKNVLQFYPENVLSTNDDGIYDIQYGFAKAFKNKFPELKNAKIIIKEVFFDDINKIQWRDIDLSEKHELTSSSFKENGFDATICFPMILMMNGENDLITGINRIKIFDGVGMVKTWFIGFVLPEGIILEKTARARMGIVANPKNVEPGQESNYYDIKKHILRRIEDDNGGKLPKGKTELQLLKLIEPYVEQEVDEYNEIKHFGIVNGTKLNSIKKEIKNLVLRDFDKSTPIKQWDNKETKKFIQKLSYVRGVERHPPTGKSLDNLKKNMEKEIVRDHIDDDCDVLELIINFPCNGSRKDYISTLTDIYKRLIRGGNKEAVRHIKIRAQMEYEFSFEECKEYADYIYNKIRFKYITPMLPEHDKSKLLLASAELKKTGFMRKSWRNRELEKLYDEEMEGLL